VSSTAACAGESAGWFTITHPFHPLLGTRYEAVARRLNWGEDRVFFYNPDGTLKSFATNVTDVVPADAFTRISAGRSAFRVDDLLELRQWLNRRQLRGKSSGDV
jgi:hypothetical protein